MAATIKISISCGCGFRTNDAKAALVHTEKTGHTQNILGVIEKREAK